MRLQDVASTIAICLTGDLRKLQEQTVAVVKNFDIVAFGNRLEDKLTFSRKTSNAL